MVYSINERNNGEPQYNANAGIVYKNAVNDKENARNRCNESTFKKTWNGVNQYEIVKDKVYVYIYRDKDKDNDVTVITNNDMLIAIANILREHGHGFFDDNNGLSGVFILYSEGSANYFAMDNGKILLHAVISEYDNGQKYRVTVNGASKKVSQKDTMLGFLNDEYEQNRISSYDRKTVDVRQGIGILLNDFNGIYEDLGIAAPYHIKEEERVVKNAVEEANEAKKAKEHAEYIAGVTETKLEKAEATIKLLEEQLSAAIGENAALKKENAALKKENEGLKGRVKFLEENIVEIKNYFIEICKRIPILGKKLIQKLNDMIAKKQYSLEAGKNENGEVDNQR